MGMGQPENALGYIDGAIPNRALAATLWRLGKGVMRREAERGPPPPPDPAAERAGLEARLAKKGIPPIHYGSTWDNWIADTPAKRGALRIVRNGAWRTNLFLTGNNGTGKTHLAVCLAKEGATYRSLRGIGLEVKADHNLMGAVTRRYGVCKLLILDEICPGDGATGFEKELLFEIADMRWGHEKPTTLITNRDRKGFCLEFGRGIYDRLRFLPVFFGWESHRKRLDLREDNMGGSDGDGGLPVRGQD